LNIEYQQFISRAAQAFMFDSKRQGFFGVGTAVDSHQEFHFIFLKVKIMLL
jgi:hypothetical protein